MDRLLVHVCCAPCLDATVVGLRDCFGDTELRGFFYNPNIHPLVEFRRRLKSAKILAETLDLPLDCRERYGLELFLREVWKDGEAGRCRRCYVERLCVAARHAQKNSFGAFTSTLCVSPHQDHSEIRQAGEEAAIRFGVDFVYRDLRRFLDETPRRPGLYRQSWCGCIFSEEERYRDTTLHLYPPPGGDAGPSGDDEASE